MHYCMGPLERYRSGHNGADSKSDGQQCHVGSNPTLSASSSSSIFTMATKIGPLAVVGNEPRQARKGAAAVTDPGAGVWLVGVASLFHN